MTHTSNNHAEEVISKWILIGSCIVIYDRLQFVFSPSLKGHLNFRAKNEFSEIKFFSPNFNISTFKSSYHLTPQTSTFQTEQILVSKGQILANQINLKTRQNSNASEFSLQKFKFPEFFVLKPGNSQLLKGRILATKNKPSRIQIILNFRAKKTEISRVLF